MIFKKPKQPVFFEETRLDGRFDEMMVWAKDLSRKDYNRLKKAMDLAYNAYQALHGIDPDDDGFEGPEFMLSDKEGK